MVLDWQTSVDAAAVVSCAEPPLANNTRVQSHRSGVLVRNRIVAVANP